MLPAVIAVLALLAAARRYRVQEQKHERLVMRRIADNYLEPHKRM
jgi:hypothetical protein